MNTCKFSIIIPAYNVEQFLPKCLDSILTQQGADFEVICVNDGSTDGTLPLLENYAEKYSNLKVVSQQNQGMSTARNRGLQEAQGEYVLFVDSDDWLCENSLQQLAQQLSGEDIVCFNAKKYIETSGQYVENELPKIDETISGWEYFNRQRLVPTEIHFVCIWQRAYKRNFLIDNKLCFAEGILRAEDDLFTTMAMYHAKTLKVVDICAYVYRVRPSSITTTVNIKRWYDSLRVQEILADFFVPLQDIDKGVVYQVLASNYIGYFSDSTIKLYGNQDKYLKERINWKYFDTVVVTKRHKRLYRLIKLSPKVFRFYGFLTSKMR